MEFCVREMRLLAAILVVGVVSGVLIPKDLNQQGCRSMCQRFGMKLKALESQFEGLRPQECMDKCNDVYPSLLEESIRRNPKLKKNAQDPVAIKK